MVGRPQVLGPVFQVVDQLSLQVQSPKVVAAVAAAGGLVSGVLLAWWAERRWRLCGDGVERALHAMDRDYAAQPLEEQLDTISASEYCTEVERRLAKLVGGPALLSPALRLAARGLYLGRRTVPRNGYPMDEEGQLQWHLAVKAEQASSFLKILRSAGVNEDIAGRARLLVSMELSPRQDIEMQGLVDTSALVFLERELKVLENQQDDMRIVEILQKSLGSMSQSAQLLALEFEFSPRLLGCFVEAWTANLQLGEQAMMYAPQIPRVTVELLRDSWAKVPKDEFSDAFFKQVFDEDESLRPVFAASVGRSINAATVVDALLDLLGVSGGRLGRVAHGLAALLRHFGLVRLALLAPIKNALVQTVSQHVAKSERRVVRRAWEAFFYCIASSAAPTIVLSETLARSPEGIATPLASPGGGPIAGSVAAQGVALLEMCLGVTLRSLGNSSSKVPSSANLAQMLQEGETLAELKSARTWLVDSIRNDVNAYSGLISTVYSRPSELSQEDLVAYENERRRWLRRATEVPIQIAEVAVGVCNSCAPLTNSIANSLKGDWIAGALLLKTAFDISMRNADINMGDLQKRPLEDKACMTDMEARLNRLKEQGSSSTSESCPWHCLLGESTS